MRDTDGTLTSGTEQEVVDMASFGADLRQIALAGPDVLYVAVNDESGSIVRVSGLNTSGVPTVEALQVHLTSHLPCARRHQANRFSWSWLISVCCHLW